jgi:peptidoglycan-associated lipoprotein
VTRPAPPPSATTEAPASDPPAVVRIDETAPVGAAAIGEDTISARPIEDLNRDSPLKPVFYASDSAELDAAGRMIVASNAQVLKQYPTWAITIEGHCDERGTAEYNFALGDLRAVAVKTYLVSLGIAPNRIETVSYGKEFAFDPGHDEQAWAKNRRAHFVITSK